VPKLADNAEAADIGVKNAEAPQRADAQFWEGRSTMEGMKA
jgi:hypothetical protein